MLKCSLELRGTFTLRVVPSFLFYCIVLFGDLHGVFAVALCFPPVFLYSSPGWSFPLDTCPEPASLALPCSQLVPAVFPSLSAPLLFCFFTSFRSPELSPPAPHPLVSFVCIQVKFAVRSLSSHLFCLPVPQAYFESKLFR